MVLKGAGMGGGTGGSCGGLTKKKCYTVEGKKGSKVGWARSAPAHAPPPPPERFPWVCIVKSCLRGINLRL